MNLNDVVKFVLDGRTDDIFVEYQLSQSMRRDYSEYLHELNIGLSNLLDEMFEKGRGRHRTKMLINTSIDIHQIELLEFQLDGPTLSAEVIEMMNACYSGNTSAHYKTSGSEYAGDYIRKAKGQITVKNSNKKDYSLRFILEFSDIT